MSCGDMTCRVGERKGRDPSFGRRIQCTHHAPRDEIRYARGYEVHHAERDEYDCCRRGMVLLIVIAAIGLTAVLAVSLVKLAVFQRAAGRTEAWQVQCRWLAESALDRAAARLAADPKYTGETWIVSAQQLGQLDGGAVRIEIRPLPDRPGQRLVRAQADYPDDPLHRARQTRETVISMNPK